MAGSKPGQDDGLDGSASLTGHARKARDEAPTSVSGDHPRILRRESPLADQTTTKPADLIYEDTGALAPLVYFDIVGAYGTMNGAVEVELATRILVPKPDGSTEVKFTYASGSCPYLPPSVLDG
jgi:hypothetical protein